MRSTHKEYVKNALLLEAKLGKENTEQKECKGFV